MLRIDARELAQFNRALKDIDKKQHAALQRRIRSVAEPIAREVRNAALGLPAGTEGKRSRLTKKRLESGERKGLRAGLAAATEVRLRNNKKSPGVRIVVSRSAFAGQTGKAASLPRYVEGLRRRAWRHPVFGKREAKWVTQQMKPFLLPTVLPHKNQVREEILDAYLDTFGDELRKHGVSYN